MECSNVLHTSEGSQMNMFILELLKVTRYSTTTIIRYQSENRDTEMTQPLQLFCESLKSP